MRKILILCAALMGIAFVTGAVPPAFAQEANSESAPLTPDSFPAISRVAVIDMKRALVTNNMWKDFQAQSDKLIEDHQRELRAAKQKLDEEGQELKSQQSLLTKEAFDEKRAAFSQKLQAAQADFAKRKQSLDEALGTARAKIEQVINNALVNVAIEYRLDLVLRKGSVDQTVVVSRDILEITNLIVERVNQNAVDVKISYP